MTIPLSFIVQKIYFQKKFFFSFLLRTRWFNNQMKNDPYIQLVTIIDFVSLIYLKK